MNPIKTKFLNLIKQAYISLVGDDDRPYPRGESTASGKISKFVRMSVYGVCSNPPKNSHVLMFNSQGRESNKFGFINDFVNRKKDLLEGEAALVNTMTGAFVLMKADGSVHISGLDKLDVDSDLNVDGDINVTGDVNIDGNANVEGDVTAVGDVTAEGDIVADSAGTAISLLDHFHQGNLGYPTDKPIMAGGGTTPSTKPTTNSNGDIITGVEATSLDNHTHPYSWTDTAGSGNTESPN